MMVYDSVWLAIDMDGDLLGFINPSLTLFSADEEAVTSCDVTSEMTLGDDVVDVTLLSEDELRIKAEPVDMYDTVTDNSIVAQTGTTSATHCLTPQNNVSGDPAD